MAIMSAQNLDLALRRGAPLEAPERWILEALCAAGDEFVTFSTLQSVSRVRNGHFYRAWGALLQRLLRRLRLPRLQEQEQGQGLPRLRRPAPGRGGRVVLPPAGPVARGGGPMAGERDRAGGAAAAVSFSGQPPARPKASTRTSLHLSAHRATGGGRTCAGGDAEGRRPGPPAAGAVRSPRPGRHSRTAVQAMEPKAATPSARAACRDLYRRIDLCPETRPSLRVLAALALFAAILRPQKLAGAAAARRGMVGSSRRSPLR